MNVFLHLKLINCPLEFFDPVILEGVVNANADNHSTSEVVHVIKKLIDSAEKAFVFCELDNADSGTISGLMMHLFKFKSKVNVVHTGYNASLVTLLNKLDSHIVKKEEVLDSAKSYFNQS